MAPLDAVVECCPSLELLELFEEIEGCRQMVPLNAVVEWFLLTLSLNVALRWSCWNYSKRSRAVVRWFCWTLLLNGSAGRCR